ncbi:hypothetical protein JCM8097_004383 [Rhodosporidiobolus ruineniae]
MDARYLYPSPPGSAYSSAASSPALPSSSTSASSHGGYSPAPSPYDYETLSPEVYQQQGRPGHGYFDARPALPARTSSYSSNSGAPSYSNAHFPPRGDSRQQHYQQQQPYRELRPQRSFHHPPKPVQYGQPVPSRQPVAHHYQQRRPAPLRGDSLPSPAHLPSGSAVAYNHPPLPSPAASSFSTASYALSSPTSASFPVPPSLPYAQNGAANASTASLGLPAASPFSLSTPAEPASPSAPVAGEGDWAFASVVSPSLLLSCDPAPHRNKNHREVVFRDAQSRQALYILREFQRGRNGRLLHDHEVRGADGLVWPEWHDGLEAAALGGGEGEGEKGRTEYLLLECPSSNAVRRAHLAGEVAEPSKLGLVTEEVLYLRGGKKVAWRSFYKRSFFGNSNREGTWKGVDGKKYRWQREERKGAYEGEAVIRLFDEKTKETMVVAREVDGKPTQLIFSALVLPSIQPVLLTLLHRSYADEERRLKTDQREWEDEEGRAW